MSHPTWVRGLKPPCEMMKIARWGVAPYVGAWIETLKGILKLALELVAPYVGAWIETPPTLPTRSICDGRTLRGCVD